MNTPLCIFYQSKSYLQILKTTEYQLNNDVTVMSFCFVNKSAAEGHHGTEVSACEDLGRVTTRRYLQVDREFQEASASLCKRRWRTFWAVTVTLLIDLTYVCCLKAKSDRNVVINWRFINFTATFSWNFIKYLILYYFRSTEVTEVKLVLQTVTVPGTVPENLAVKFRTTGTIMHFCVVGSFILPHPVVLLYLSLQFFLLF